MTVSAAGFSTAFEMPAAEAQESKYSFFRWRWCNGVFGRDVVRFCVRICRRYILFGSIGHVWLVVGLVQYCLCFYMFVCRILRRRVFLSKQSAEIQPPTACLFSNSSFGTFPFRVFLRTDFLFCGFVRHRRLYTIASIIPQGATVMRGNHIKIFCHIGILPTNSLKYHAIGPHCRKKRNH